MNLETLKKSVGLLKALTPSQITALTQEEKLALGQQLWWLYKRADKLLDPIRVELRQAALTLAGGEPGAQRFDGPDEAQATVIVVNSIISVRKDADMPGLKAVLGDGLFDALFETVVTYKPRVDFGTRTAACNSVQTTAVNDVLDVKPGTPRVSFRD